jgi:ATP-dependent DNA helicase RecG
MVRRKSRTWTATTASSACYQHCALKWVMSERMTNQSLRERFHLPESKTAIVSQVIAATIEAGLVKADERVGASRKFARYLILGVRGVI